MAPVAWVHSFVFLFSLCPPLPLLYETGKDPRGERGLGKEGNGWEAQRAEKWESCKEKGRTPGTGRRRRPGNRDGGWERVNRSRRPGSPPPPCTLRLREAKPENPTLDESREAAQVGNLDCGFSAAQTSALCARMFLFYVHTYVPCYIIWVKDACVAKVRTGAPRPTSFMQPVSQGPALCGPRLPAPFTPRRGTLTLRLFFATSTAWMKTILSTQTVDTPKGTQSYYEGPRGTLQRDFRHLSVAESLERERGGSGLMNGAE